MQEVGVSDSLPIVMFQKSGGFYRSSAYIRGKRQRTLVIKAITFVLFFFLVLFIMGYTGFSTVRVHGDAMNPACSDGDRMFSAALPYGIRFGTGTRKYFGFSSPDRGDVVLLRPAYNAYQSRLTSLVDSVLRTVTFQKLTLTDILGEDRGDTMFLRRIIGLPGDALYIENGRCFIKPAGSSSFRNENELSPVPYDILIDTSLHDEGGVIPGPYSLGMTVLKKNEYFVMGDNRKIMDDSRFWGPLPDTAILGKVLLSYWSAKH